MLRNPFESIRCLVERKTLNGTDFFLDERITAQQALESYTCEAAAATGSVDTGILRVGMRAVIVLLDRSPLAFTPDEISATGVQLTLLGGEATFGTV